MIRNEDEFAKKITGYLDIGAASLKAGTAYRLQQARARALDRLADPVPVGETRLAHALVGGGSAGGSRRGLWLACGVLLLAALAFGWQQWKAYQQANELADIDVQILSSDLPIDAYLDRGFQTWLTRYQP
ncbi:MAG: DUF3619 family protein [Burkholderiales bacterium]